MNSALFALVASLLLLVCAQAHNGQKCLSGEKEAPSAESGNFTACSAYKNKSCCSAAFTSQLASPVTRIGNFTWIPCKVKQLTKRCEAFMVKVECFYRCSPNVWYWRNPSAVNAFEKAPLCSGFCDSWFDACKDDLTCAKNWLTDFDFTTTPNSCKMNATCQKMGTIYADGKDMCNNIWGASFVYKESEKANDCLKLDFTGPNPNDKVVDTYFSNSTATVAPTAKTETPTTVPSSAGAVQGVLAIALAASAFSFLF